MGGYVIPAYNSGDGRCKYLGEDNKCKIYNNRPDICRTDKNISSEEEKAVACEALRKLFKVVSKNVNE
jgi:Fe-S-cluster containining protein